MGLFSKFKAGLQKTQSQLAHEIKRIVTRSPKLDAASLEELEAALIAADLGLAVTAHIVAESGTPTKRRAARASMFSPSRGARLKKISCRTRRV
jgi:fused signal recognition particle receptor